MALLFFDPYAQLRLVDFVVPFLGAYRPLWLGLGTLAFDLLAVVVVVTSLLRHRLGVRVFRDGALGDAMPCGRSPWRTRSATEPMRATGGFCCSPGSARSTVCGALVWRLHANYTEYAGHPNVGAPMTTSRLFAARPARGLAEHQQRFGPLPDSAGNDIGAPVLDQSGLTGRGGAGFPTGRKIASVTGRKAVVIGNGAEGEPLSHKDAATAFARTTPRPRRSERRGRRSVG